MKPIKNIEQQLTQLLCFETDYRCSMPTINSSIIFDMQYCLKFRDTGNTVGMVPVISVHETGKFIPLLWYMLALRDLPTISFDILGINRFSNKKETDESPEYHWTMLPNDNIIPLYYQCMNSDAMDSAYRSKYFILLEGLQAIYAQGVSYHDPLKRDFYMHTLCERNFDNQYIRSYHTVLADLISLHDWVYRGMSLRIDRFPSEQHEDLLYIGLLIMYRFLCNRYFDNQVIALPMVKS